MAKVLVTGGAGFIGGHLVDRLVNAGYSVRVLDDLSTGSLSNLDSNLTNPNFEVIRGDIFDESIVKSAMKGIDSVYHLAALVGVTQSLANPDRCRKINVEGTLNLLRNAQDNGVGLFVFTSTAAVYGNSTPPLSEESLPNPVSPYAETKLAAEQRCLEYFKNHGLGVTVLRLFNVYGPRQDEGPYSSVISRFLRSWRTAEPLMIEGDGEQSRDFIHVNDVVDCLVSILQKGDLVGQVFNLGSGKPTTINQLVEIVRQLANTKKIEVKHTRPRMGDLRHSFADVSKARKMFGFSPKLGLLEGLESLVHDVAPNQSFSSMRATN